MTTVTKHDQASIPDSLSPFAGGSNLMLSPPLFENAIASNLASPHSSSPPLILPLPPSSSLSPQSIVNLCSYIPSTVVQFLARNEFSVPARHKLTTAVLFADISGFTSMCELLGATHSEIEDLARIVKAYFGILVKVVQRHGGDVFKFAGDAVIVLWPETEDSLTVLARRCAQCALEIQRNLHGLTFQDSNGKHQFELSLKIGIGVGDVTIFHIGGFERRMEYLAAGSPLTQAFLCESIAAPGTVVVSLQTAALIAPFFQTAFSTTPAHNEQITGMDLIACKKPLAKRGIVSTVDTATDLVMWVDNPVTLNEILQRYVPVSVLPFVGELEERWASEIRKITVVFAHISFDFNADDESDQNLMRLQKVMETIQQSVYSNGGAVNKFLFDDKGMSVLAVFGLLPLAHPNDSLRGVLGAKSICMTLAKLSVVANCGVTTGYAFCGVTGGNTRREFSVLGDVVNISARLMQYAIRSSLALVVDNATRYATRSLLSYKALEPIKVKGKTSLTRLFVPVNEFFPAKSAVVSFSTDLNQPYRDVANLSSIFTNERDVLRSKLRQTSASGRGLEQVAKQLSLEQASSSISPLHLPVYSFPVKNAIKYLRVILDDGSQTMFDCSNILTVAEAKLEAYRLGIIPHLEYTLITSTSCIPVDNWLRLDLIPVLAYDMEFPTNGLLVVKLTTAIIDDCDSTLNLGRQGARLQIARTVNKFMETGEMQCIFLEGDLGSGKTHTFASSICDTPLTVVCGRGSQLPSNRDLFVWKQVMVSVVDRFLRYEHNDDCPSDDRRRQFIQTILKTWQDPSEIAKIISFMLDEERDLSQQETTILMSCPTPVVDLIVRFVVDIAKYEPLVVLIDNAQFLNNGSTAVLKALLDSRSKGVLLGLAIRSNTSLAITWMLPSMNSILAEYPGTRIRLRRLPTAFMRKLVASILDIQEVPDKILVPILNKSEGNPMICRELVYSVHRLGYIRVSNRAPSGEFDLYVSEEFFASPVFPVPFTLQNTLGELVDSLSHCQRMILKVASILGQNFTYETIAAGYPIDEHQPILFRELQGLLQRNVLRPVISNKGDEKRHSLPTGQRTISSKTLTFSTIFLMDFVRSRILSRQVKYIASRITQMHFRNNERLVLYSGPMSVCKEPGRHRKFLGISRWRSMWVEADAVKINIFKKAGELIGKTGEVLPWVQIQLIHAELKTSHPEDRFPYVIYIKTNSWHDRRGQVRPGPLGLFLATAVEHDIKQWVSYLTLTSRMKSLDISRPQLIRSQTACNTGNGGSSDSDPDMKCDTSPMYTLRKIPPHPRATTAIPDSSHLRILWNTFKPQIQRRLTK